MQIRFSLHKRVVLMFCISSYSISRYRGTSLFITHRHGSHMQPAQGLDMN